MVEPLPQHEPVMVEDAWGTAVSLEKVAEAIARHPDAKVLAFVHAETSTGVRSDAASLCRMAGEAGMLSIVHTVTEGNTVCTMVNT